MDRSLGNKNGQDVTPGKMALRLYVADYIQPRPGKVTHPGDDERPPPASDCGQCDVLVHESTYGKGEKITENTADQYGGRSSA